MDEPCLIANPARGQLKTGKMIFSISLFAPEIRSRETGSDVPSRVTRSFSTITLNLVHTHGIILAFRDGVHIQRQPPSGHSRVYQTTQLRIDGVHCLESAGKGPVVKVVPAKSADHTYIAEYGSTV